jgi:hypothetical protein
MISSVKACVDNALPKWPPDGGVRPGSQRKKGVILSINAKGSARESDG